MEDFKSYISAAADALSPFDYEIKTTLHQTTRQRTWSLINSTSDPLTQIATIHTAEEIGFTKRMLDAMFETFNTRRKEVMAVTGMQALSQKILKGSGGGGRASLGEGEGEKAADKGLTSREAETLLDALITEGWFERSREGFYTLSPRALMELRSWLVETYNEETDDPGEWQRIKFCEACKEIVTVGQRCANLECNVRLHDICGTYWNSRPDKKCPKCKTDWDEEHWVGQRVVTCTDDYLRGKRRSGGAVPSRGKRGRQQEEEEEEEEVEENAGEEEEE